MKREISTGQEGILAKHLDKLARNIVILKDHASAAIKKERLSPTSKERRKASRNKFVEKGGMPDRIKSFGKNSSREDRLRAQPGFAKPI